MFVRTVSQNAQTVSQWTQSRMFLRISYLHILIGAFVIGGQGLVLQSKINHRLNLKAGRLKSGTCAEVN